MSRGMPKQKECVRMPQAISPSLTNASFHVRKKACTETIQFPDRINTNGHFVNEISSIFCRLEKMIIHSFFCIVTILSVIFGVAYVSVIIT